MFHGSWVMGNDLLITLGFVREEHWELEEPQSIHQDRGDLLITQDHRNEYLQIQSDGHNQLLSWSSSSINTFFENPLQLLLVKSVLWLEKASDIFQTLENCPCNMVWMFAIVSVVPSYFHNGIVLSMNLFPPESGHLNNHRWTLMVSCRQFGV